MAKYMDVPFEELIKDAPKHLSEMGGNWMVYANPPIDEPGEPQVLNGVLVKFEAKQTLAWPIKGGTAYRITANKVTALPYIEKDQNSVRRFCRLNNITLRDIIIVERNKPIRFVASTKWQGDDGYRSLGSEDPPVYPVTVETCGNPSLETRILVVRGEGEKLTWDQFCEIAQNWNYVKYGQWKLQ